MKQRDFQEKKAWADKFLPEIESIIRKVAGKIISIREATEEEDTKQSTDYVIEISSGRIGCRVRDYKYVSFNDVTIRAWLSSGVRTEIDKLREGLLQWYLYMWISDERMKWVFWNVDKALQAGLFNGSDIIKNKDMMTGFVSIPISTLSEKECVVDIYDGVRT